MRSILAWQRVFVPRRDVPQDDWLGRAYAQDPLPAATLVPLALTPPARGCRTSPERNRAKRRGQPLAEKGEGRIGEATSSWLVLLGSDSVGWLQYDGARNNEPEVAKPRTMKWSISCTYQCRKVIGDSLPRFSVFVIFCVLRQTLTRHRATVLHTVVREREEQ